MEPRKSPPEEEATEPDEHDGGAAGGRAAETGRVCACDRPGWRGGQPAAAVPFVDTASLTRLRCSLMWLQRIAAGRSVGAPVGRPHPPPHPSGYPPEQNSERWQLCHSVTAQHAANARARAGAAGGRVGRLVHQTAHPPPAAGRQSAPAHTGTRWLPRADGSAPRVFGPEPGVACSTPVAKGAADRKILRGPRAAPP